MIFNLDSQVSFPRTSGGRSNGTLARLDPEAGRVLVKFEEGGTAKGKWVDPRDLLPVRGPSPPAGRGAPSAAAAPARGAGGAATSAREVRFSSGVRNVPGMDDVPPYVAVPLGSRRRLFHLDEEVAFVRAGAMREGTLARLDPEAGRVLVRFERDGTTVEEWIDPRDLNVSSSSQSGR